MTTTNRRTLPPPPRQAPARETPRLAEYKADDGDIALPLVPGVIADHFGGKPVTRQAVYQWKDTGLIARDGSRVKLQVRQIGNRIFTRLEWIKAFIDAI